MNENPVDMIIEHSDIDISECYPEELERMRSYCAELIEDVTRHVVRKTVEGIVGSFDEPSTFTQENFDKLKRMVAPYHKTPKVSFPPTDKNSLMSSAWFPFRMDKIRPVINVEGAA